MAATYHENDENDLPDALHLDAFVVVRDRADDAFVVFVDDVVDVLERRRDAERHRKWDDDERHREEQDGVANVALEDGRYLDTC